MGVRDPLEHGVNFTAITHTYFKNQLARGVTVLHRESNHTPWSQIEYVGWKNLRAPFLGLISSQNENSSLSAERLQSARRSEGEEALP